MPARSAGDPSVTSCTSAPSSTGSFSDRCRSSIDVAQRHADVAARHAAALPELRQDRRRAVDRHGEADVARARADRGVDADDLAARVDQRPAAVAEVDGRVGLDVVVEARVEELPADEADDADRDRVLVAERVADRAHPLAHPQRRRIADRRDRQARLAVDLDQRDVGVGIGADDARAQRPAVRQLDDDPLGALDDMVVGEDAAVGVDDEAAARAAPRVCRSRGAVEVERAAEVRRIAARPAPAAFPSRGPSRRCSPPPG